MLSSSIFISCSGCHGQNLYAIQLLDTDVFLQLFYPMSPFRRHLTSFSHLCPLLPMHLSLPLFPPGILTLYLQTNYQPLS